MSEKTRSIVEKLYQNFAAHDVPSNLELLDDELVFVLTGPPDITPFAGEFRGKVGYADWAGRLASSTVMEAFEITLIVDRQSKGKQYVDVHCFEKGKSIATGKTWESRTLHLWEVNEAGKVVSFFSFNDSYAVAQAYISD